MKVNQTQYNKKYHIQNHPSLCKPALRQQKIKAISEMINQLNKKKKKKTSGKV